MCEVYRAMFIMNGNWWVIWLSLMCNDSQGPIPVDFGGMSQSGAVSQVEALHQTLSSIMHIPASMSSYVYKTPMGHKQHMGSKTCIVTSISGFLHTGSMVRGGDGSKRWSFCLLGSKMGVESWLSKGPPILRKLLLLSSVYLPLSSPSNIFLFHGQSI